MEKRYLVFKLEGGHVVKEELSEPGFVGVSDEKIISATLDALNVLTKIGKPFSIISGEVINVAGVQSVTIERVGGIQ